MMGFKVGMRAGGGLEQPSDEGMYRVDKEKT